MTFSLPTQPISLRALLAAAALALGGCGREAAAPALPDLVETLTPSVVNISASPPTTGEANARQSLSLGSGFIWLADGYIITNAHVVSQAPQGLTVKLQNRHEYTAQVIGIDQSTDLALLKIDAPDLAAVAVADPARLRIGESVVAIGAPYGFDHTVTTGILSAKARSLSTDQYVPYLQTDAAISPGNSGGPLFNARGSVVGVTTQILADQQGMGIGAAFAIPIDVAVRVAEQLRDHGRVRRAWLGLVVEGLDAPSAAALGLETVRGARITEVTSDSPAAESGLRVGDVVLAIEGRPLNGSRDLPPLMGVLTPGAMVTVDLVRDGRPVQIRVELSETEPERVPSSTRPPPSPWGESSAAAPVTPAPSEPRSVAGHQDNPLGIRVESQDAGQRNSIPLLGGGVRIVQVDSEPAVRAGLRVDDLLLQVNGQSVNSPERFDEVVGRLTPEASVPLLVQRRGSPLFLTLDMPRRP